MFNTIKDIYSEENTTRFERFNSSSLDTKKFYHYESRTKIEKKNGKKRSSGKKQPVGKHEVKYKQSIRKKLTLRA